MLANLFYKTIKKEYAAKCERNSGKNDSDIEKWMSAMLYKTLRYNSLCYGDKIEWGVKPVLHYDDKFISIYTRFKITRKRINWLNRTLNRLFILNRPWNTTDWSLEIFNKRLLKEYKGLGMTNEK